MMRRTRCATAGLATLALTVVPCVAGAEEFERTLEVEPDVRVEIELWSGDIELEGTASDEMRIQASEELEIDADEDGRRVSIRARSGGWRSWAGSHVDLEIELPRGARIDARTQNGDVEAEGVEGELRFQTANGKIEVEGAPREAYFEAMNAPIKFEGRLSEVYAKTLHGAIELEGVSGDVEASTLSGSIRVEGHAIERAALRTMAGGIELDGSLARGARIEAKTYSGAVKLRLPEDASARFEVQSFSGGIDSDFASRFADEGGGFRPGPGRRLSFVVGDGDARISIESFSGGVQIERAD